MLWVKADDLRSPIYPMMRFLDSKNTKYGRILRNVPMLELQGILDSTDLANLDMALEGRMIEEKAPTVDFKLSSDDVLDLIECATAWKKTNDGEGHTPQYVRIRDLQTRLMKSYLNGENVE